MLTFNIPDMTCGHCRNVISDAIFDLDENAELSFDMATKNLEIQSEEEISTLELAIKNTGYKIAHMAQVVQAPINQGSCCGHCG